MSGGDNMKRVSAIILCVLCAVTAIVFAGCGSDSSETAEETRAVQETLAEDVKTQLDSILEKVKYSGAVQITKGGSVIYQYVSGNDDNGKPLTIDSSLPIGSVSKQFCAACIMLLCEQNKLSVDDTLDKYFPEYKYGKDITIKNLLTMSSGIPNYYRAIIDPSKMGPDEAENIAAIKKALLAEELNFEPGDDYEYSNSNFFLLADIVEQVSGVSYHEFLRKNFFEPLEMTHTGFVEEIADDPEWSSALSKTELMAETSNPGPAKGAGDIVANAEDMYKWMRGLSGGKVISTGSFREMTVNVNENSAEGYSYGLWQMPYDGVGHVGQIAPAFGAVDYLNPGRDLYLFASANNWSSMSFVQQLPQTLLEVLYEDE